MKTRTKILTTLVCMVVVVAAMIVGVFAAASQAVGGSFTIKFNATSVNATLYGTVFGATSASYSSTGSDDIGGGTVRAGTYLGDKTSYTWFSSENAKELIFNTDGLADSEDPAIIIRIVVKGSGSTTDKIYFKTLVSIGSDLVNLVNTDKIIISQTEFVGTLNASAWYTSGNILNGQSAVTATSFKNNITSGAYSYSAYNSSTSYLLGNTNYYVQEIKIEVKDKTLNIDANNSFDISISIADSEISA